MIISATGHRLGLKLGGHSEGVRRRLRSLAIDYLQAEQPQTVISGMALGWDTAVAEAAIELHLPFIAAVPFEGQERRWPPESQAHYARLLEQAASVEIVYRTTVVHKDDGYDVAVDRGTKWGNPFRIGADGTREQVIEKHREYLDYHPELVNALPELRGKRLGCHCAPKACHGDTLAALANAQPIYGRYVNEAMQQRNEWMVDRGHKMCALWDGSMGGTFNCIRYAKKVGRPIDNLWPRWANDLGDLLSS